MPSRTRYLFDSDVLISSARLHYAPEYCQVFWDWLSAGNSAGMFFSIDKVKGELLDGDGDLLNSWAESNPDFFQSSTASLPAWGRLSTIANDPQKQFRHSAKSKFLDLEKADAWLIAHAATNGNFVIVTNEKSEPLSKREIKLPDAAAWLQVNTVKLFDVLRAHAGHNFSPKLMSALSNALSQQSPGQSPAV
ncbi:DUF4411 family protein [Azospira sp.]|uniref:DUF4411 family protein n=1 Tax=Azospira sp. TaxID=1872671 RepID=UPI0025617CBA|nr:DUF4411 family protein [Azospira sp.]MDK9691275.1 DUF4411 family protein [Azospira sp.]